MNEEKRWQYLLDLDDELLKGGVIMSEWCTFITRDADIAFAKGAPLASILTAVAAIETHLRSESEPKCKETLYELVKNAEIEESLKGDIQRLRRYRNKWVHVNDPWEDHFLLENPDRHEKELEEIAILAARVLRKVLYSFQWV